MTVQFVYGSFVLGGVGLFIYFSQSYEIGMRPLEIAPVLLTIEGDTINWGFPLPEIRTGPSAADHGGDQISYSLPLLRWQF